MSRIQQLLHILKESRKSEALLILLLVVAADLVLRAGFFIHDKTNSNLNFDVPYRSRAWWSAQDFLRRDNPPDVVLLGASDINTALYAAEATYFKKPQSQLLKHNSEYLESKLKEFGSPYKTTFCLSIGGEMPSDSYFLANTLLTRGKLPKAIFIAVNPRNFYDATFGDPANTAIYKTMAKLGGTRDFEFSCRSSIWETADYLCRQAISSYGHKWEITSWQQRVGQSVLEKFLPETFTDVTTPSSVRKIAELDLPEDFGPNEQMMMPYDEKHPIFVDNLHHYLAHYKNIKRGMLPQQLDFYERLCEFCSSHGVKLVACNSPVTNENRNLIPPDIYAKYLAHIDGITRRYGGNFVNLDKPELFAKSDFYDSVHLNGVGAQKYLDRVALILSKYNNLATSVNFSTN